MAPILVDFLEHGASSVKSKRPITAFFPKLFTVHELEPTEVVSHALPRGLIVCLGVFEMEAKHAKNLHATEAVEALWSEQGSQDATYRIALVWIQGSRDDVCQIANALPQMEWFGVSGTCAALGGGVSSNEGARGKMSSWVVGGGGGVSSNQGGGGMIGSPVDMFDSRDGETCMGGDGTSCGMIAGVSCSVGIHCVSGSS